MWNQLEIGWKKTFEIGWNAFKEKTIPIGASIVNTKGDVVSIGQNKIYVDRKELSQITNHNLAHAEINAILSLTEDKHPDIRTYTLYTTTEPCPLCFGAIVMGNIRNVQFAARDPYAGAASLNSKLEYVKSKNIIFKGPFEEIEFYQNVVTSYFELERFRANRVLNAIEEVCPEGVAVAKQLYNKKTLRTKADNHTSVEEVYNMIISNF